MTIDPEKVREIAIVIHDGAIRLMQTHSHLTAHQSAQLSFDAFQKATELIVILGLERK